jgi:hypothetical protein
MRTGDSAMKPMTCNTGSRPQRQAVEGCLERRVRPHPLTLRPAWTACASSAECGQTPPVRDVSVSAEANRNCRNHSSRRSHRLARGFDRSEDRSHRVDHIRDHSRRAVKQTDAGKAAHAGGAQRRRGTCGAGEVPDRRGLPSCGPRGIPALSNWLDLCAGDTHSRSLCMATRTSGRRGLQRGRADALVDLRPDVEPSGQTRRGWSDRAAG